MTLGIETRDGAVEAVERIRQLDGEVGAKGEDAAAAAPDAKWLLVTEASTAVRSEAARTHRSTDCQGYAPSMRSAPRRFST